MLRNPAPVTPDRAEAAERELQTFSYLVSHDLAASLRQVTEFSRLLAPPADAGLAGEDSLHARLLLNASAKCQLMLEELLVFSRAQQKALARAPQDAAAILRLPLLRLASQAQAAGGDITVGPLGEVFADPDLFLLAIGRLLDNAIKFRRTGIAPRITVEAAHDATFWRVRISDNGLGVEPAYREKAFEMFQRLNAESAYPGVGAGLAICRRIARRHGGEAEFLDCDEGACVQLSLPHAGRSPCLDGGRRHG
jgi:light-regulated signal transduction histidine kinase (bacteriophytochrome)